MPSFDIVSEIDMQEVDNAVNQARKEIEQRYDFKGSKSEINLEKEKEKEGITVLADDDYKLKAIIDILQSKFIKRGISIKSLDYGKAEAASGSMVRQVIKLKNGIPTEKAKEIIKIIKETKLKVQSQIQEEQVRVTGKNIDDLQEIMALLKGKELDIPLQFENFRP
ncbi:MAG: YajQ family cyclic di-GMP-binding protein [Deltaproteobacteria bacterium]|nr:YajQ family cyclic di-GMP-binding protein [Deltaproteobacteria bacterium]